MQLIGNAAKDRDPRAPEPLRPGLDVSVLTLASDAAEPEIHLSVRGGVGPVRLYLYVDGDLRDSQTSASERYRITLAGLGLGRHTVTARAIDATGRWGGASIMVGVSTASESPAVEA
jgi:hypothetical protein